MCTVHGDRFILTINDRSNSWSSFCQSTSDVYAHPYQHVTNNLVLSDVPNETKLPRYNFQQTTQTQTIMEKISTCCFLMDTKCLQMYTRTIVFLDEKPEKGF